MGRGVRACRDVGQVDVSGQVYGSEWVGGYGGWAHKVVTVCREVEFTSRLSGYVDCKDSGARCKVET